MVMPVKGQTCKAKLQSSVDLYLEDDIYWIFQFTKIRSKPLTASCVEQALQCWGQTVPECISKAPKDALVYLRLPPPTNNLLEASCSKPSKASSDRQYLMGTIKHTEERPGHRNMPALTATTCTNADVVHAGHTLALPTIRSPRIPSPDQQLLAAATATLFELHVLMQTSSRGSMAVSTACPLSYDSGEMALLEAHERRSGCLHGLRIMLGNLVRPSQPKELPLNECEAQGSETVASSPCTGSLARIEAAQLRSLSQEQYQHFKAQWGDPASKQPPWLKQRQITPRNKIPVCTGTDLNSHAAADASAHEATRTRQQYIGQEARQTEEEMHWYLEVLKAEAALRQAMLQLHQEQNAWAERRWEHGEAAALAKQRILELRVAAAQKLHRQLITKLKPALAGGPA